MPATLEVNGTASEPTREKKARLVLCFDGTGNIYNGDTSDTNIVKLYQKLDRQCPDQYHYYQPGIGTYVTGHQSINTGIFGRFKRRLSQLIDQGVGTTFDQHVLAGYRFIMRYYNEGDHIYIFGFSRGAFTARFVARMITTIGVLSKGNEEMVPFAYKTYQDYEQGIGFPSVAASQKYMHGFKRTFCRLHGKVHFLGLFDTVNSVATFDVPFRRPKYLPTVLGTASHIRHAVSLDERRLKFKPALLVQDQQDQSNSDDIKEVFFVGNHGDVGGGWAAPGDNQDDDEANDPLQLSDIALEWMISELRILPTEQGAEKLYFNSNVDVFLKNFNANRQQAYRAAIHDPLVFGKGLSWYSVIMWNIMEFLPIFKRKELIKKEWKAVYLPPNMRDTRDLPSTAVVHPSVLDRMNAIKDYKPRNKGFAEAYKREIPSEAKGWEGGNSSEGLRPCVEFSLSTRGCGEGSNS